MIRPCASFLAALKRIHACSEARDWVAAQTGSSKEAWDACERGDWMLWLVGRLSGNVGSQARRNLSACLLEVVEALAPPLVQVEDVGAIQTQLAVVARYARGEDVSREALYEAARAIRATGSWKRYWTDAADDAAAIYAAAIYAAADAAAVANAYAAANNAVAAVDAATAADAAYAYDSLRACADIVRAHYPAVPKIGGCS